MTPLLMTPRPVVVRPSRITLVVRSVGRPALVGIAAGAVAAAVLPSAPS